MKEIKANGIILAKHIPSEEWQEGLRFYSNDQDFIQVGTWGYDAGKELLAHAHNSVERKVLKTQEVLYIRKGSVLAQIYDSDKNIVKELVIKEGDTLIALEGGHGYKVLEEGTQVLEVKNGPYLGAEVDRQRIDVKK
ncbi:MAG: hypothetical protein DRR16_26590 [Candidatus Parabeggiatoa sp. nov. 3]|nr:MAG: hypothetical protein DRR00_26775 [Gammaproteobacteria bacterium]RKZ63638.1 MAG: hypothetical protein DRQ99_16765 [Gammaproteobacteria bacterium]RKZ78996.1 MAG: hypothetical protein DRR16_26590 [Gammaproteobacteria bacterium]HEW92455.1 hypothetical protein [Thermotogaceae bacterium]